MRARKLAVPEILMSSKLIFKQNFSLKRENPSNGNCD